MRFKADCAALLQRCGCRGCSAGRVEADHSCLIGIEVALPSCAWRYWLSGDRVQIPTDTATRRRRIWGIADAVIVRETVAALNASR